MALPEVMTLVAWECSLTSCELSMAGMRAAELRQQLQHGSAWQKRSRNCARHRSTVLRETAR